jgi:hypothetical protein
LLSHLEVGYYAREKGGTMTDQLTMDDNWEPRRGLRWGHVLGQLMDQPGKWGLIEKAPKEERRSIYSKAWHLKKQAARLGRWIITCKSEGDFILIVGKYLGENE